MISITLEDFKAAEAFMVDGNNYLVSEFLNFPSISSIIFPILTRCPSATARVILCTSSNKNKNCLKSNVGYLTDQQIII